ncbi:MAG: peptidylprolyl isomerase [Flavobacteriales bacterium]|nr:peptidylprolyl isomerase [Flavobacteriales bacterium]
MKYLFFSGVLYIFIIFLSSCSDEPTNTKTRATKTQIKKEIPEKPKDKPPKIEPLISDSNVVEFLTRYGKENKETNVRIYTTFGLIKARLFRDTPLHRASFLLWAKKGFYNGSVFMRVTPNFIAQGGTTSSDSQMQMKREIGNYTIPAEFSKTHFHKQGAIGMARHYEDNPDKRSDSHRFYFVEGTTYNRPTLAHYEKTQNYSYSQEQLDYYTSGNLGAAHIDGEHTVFGELISGQEVVKKLTEVPTDSRDWPLKDIYIDSVVVY